MAVSDLVVAWEESSVIRSRFRRSMKWLQWPVQSTDALEGSEHDDEKIEKHLVSTKALELNVDALLAMLDAFNGNFIDIYALQTEVKELYKLMKYDTMDVKKDSYLDSWDLRRLYSYAFRRQLDAAKRVQVPRDEKVKLLFQRIATLRKQWKDLEQWDEHTPDGNDDDRFEAAEQSPRNQCPDGTPASTVADSQVSSPSGGSVPGSAEMAVQRQLEMLDVPHASFSEDQRHLLFSLLSEIGSYNGKESPPENMPSRKSTSASPASAMPALMDKPQPKPAASDPSQDEPQPMTEELALPASSSPDLKTPSPVVNKQPLQETPDKVDAPAKVTPLLQSEMRAGKRKTLKRGRKNKRGILKAKKGNTKVSSKSKGEGMAGKKGARKAAGTKAKTRLAGSTGNDFEQEAAKPKRKRASTPKQEVADAAEPTKPRGRKAKAQNEGCVKQDRVGEGKNWRYKVVEGQRFGCTNCRFIYNGCKNCQKETFKGRSAQQVWEEEDCVEEEHAEPVAPAPRKGKGKKSKKA